MISIISRNRSNQCRAHYFLTVTMWEPFGTPSTNSTAYWKSGPNERGTLNVLSTCVLTLVLCAYTCLHLNIPEHKKTSLWKQFRLRAIWVVIGLAAPEVVAFIAFRQWLFARNFERQMNDRLNLNKSGASDLEQTATTEKKDERENPWTRTHSHFALMGGFAFDTHKSRINYLPYRRTRLTLTPHALRKLAEYEPDLIPDISKEDIDDKSKADWFAKSLACIQACWFIVQFVGRLAGSLPISLLEMNTFLHALCCLIIYMAWWDKPLGIDEPELIKADEGRAQKVCAWMVMNSSVGQLKPVNPAPVSDCPWACLVHDEDITRKDSNNTNKRFQASLAAANANNKIRHREDEVQFDQVASQQDPSSDSYQPCAKLYLGQKLFGFRLVYTRSSDIDPDACTNLNLGELECLRLAAELRAESSATHDWQCDWSAEMDCRQGMLKTHVSLDSSLEDQTLGTFTGSTWISRRLSNAEIVYGMLLLFAGSIYGLVHLLAWNGPFATTTERVMWRISCFIIASPFVLGLMTASVFGGFYLLYLLTSSEDIPKTDSNDPAWIIGWVGAMIFYVPLDACKSFFTEKLKVQDWRLVRMVSSVLRRSSREKSLEKVEEKKSSSSGLLLGLLFILGASACLVYVAARVFLLVECFINLAHLPPAVYVEPEWSQYLPHFGSG